MTKKNYLREGEEASRSKLNEPVVSYGSGETIGISSPAQYTLDELKIHLAISLEDIKAGRIHAHDDIPNLYPQWKLQ